MLKQNYCHKPRRVLTPFTEPDWFVAYDQQKVQDEAIHRLKVRNRMSMDRWFVFVLFLLCFKLVSGKNGIEGKKRREAEEVERRVWKCKVESQEEG